MTASAGQDEWSSVASVSTSAHRPSATLVAASAQATPATPARRPRQTIADTRESE